MSTTVPDFMKTDGLEASPVDIKEESVGLNKTGGSDKENEVSSGEHGVTKNHVPKKTDDDEKFEEIFKIVLGKSTEGITKNDDSKGCTTRTQQSVEPSEPKDGKLIFNVVLGEPAEEDTNDGDRQGGTARKDLSMEPSELKEDDSKSMVQDRDMLKTGKIDSNFSQEDPNAQPQQEAPKRYVYPFIPDPAPTKPVALKAPEKVYEGTINTDPEIAARQCKICYKVFRNKDKLKRHATSHQKEAEATCANCGIEIKYRYNLKDHMTKCIEETMEDFDEKIIHEIYPKFSASLERFRRDPFSKPELPPGYTMDKYGRVTGFDLGLVGQFKFVVPKYDSNFDQEGVLKLVQNDEKELESCKESVCELPYLLGENSE